ncbi:hypothetical protein QL919_02900 [Psychrobacter sp. APC 3426]|uniref:hypothetical protein n=1 Tax=Psychrobacter sp. APC 3426 TaxID=3035177 RepID=UPI0025B42258|nr:hypothetical protein [Psychrobacter sp. APC 3426]MDN3397674.1 hypothetical protein [Psychrobacter sp. APC 3426]
MSNCIKIDIKPNHGSNYSYKHSNLSINDMNLILVDSISSAIDKMKDTTASITLGLLFSDVTPVITHLFDFSDCRKQCFTSHDNKRYYRPTTKLIAVKPSRHTLAIFVPIICLTTNQQMNKGINKNKSALQARHKYSTVESANIYDGLIEPNTIAFVVNKLNRLLAVVKTRRPFFMGDHKLTNLIGAIHNG